MEGMAMTSAASKSCCALSGVLKSLSLEIPARVQMGVTPCNTKFDFLPPALITSLPHLPPSSMATSDQKRRAILARLPHFELTRILDDDPGSKSAILLGTLPSVVEGGTLPSAVESDLLPAAVDGETTPSTETVRQPAIITLSKTHIPSSVLSEGQPLFAPAAGEAISPALASIDIGTLLVEESTDIVSLLLSVIIMSASPFENSIHGCSPPSPMTMRDRTNIAM